MILIELYFLLFKVQVAKASESVQVVKAGSVVEVTGDAVVVAGLMVGQIIVITPSLRGNILLLPLLDGIKVIPDENI